MTSRVQMPRPAWLISYLNMERKRLNGWVSEVVYTQAGAPSRFAAQHPCEEKERGRQNYFKPINRLRSQWLTGQMLLICPIPSSCGDYRRIRHPPWSKTEMMLLGTPCWKPWSGLKVGYWINPFPSSSEYIRVQPQQGEPKRGGICWGLEPGLQNC